MNKLGICFPSKDFYTLEQSQLFDYINLLQEAGISSFDFYTSMFLEESTHLDGVLEYLKKQKLGITFHYHSHITIDKDNLNYEELCHQYILDLTKVRQTLLKNGIEEKTTVVFHAPDYPNENKKQHESSLVKLYQELSERALPLRFKILIETLSKNHPKGDHVGDDWEEITFLIEHVSHDNFGICWDVGHTRSNHLEYKDSLLFPSEILSHVDFVHIHNVMFDPTSNQWSDHLPFTSMKYQEEELVYLIEKGYQGILSIEFDTNELKEKIFIYLDSIKKIKRKLEEKRMSKLTMEKLVNLTKQYGFIFQGSEVYGGLANTWDYGPLGVELKNNVKRLWWKRFVQESPNSYGVDAAILMNPKVWEASGHVGGFTDPLLDCKECKTRHRADKLIENFDAEINADALNEEEMMNYIRENQIPCPSCKKSNYTDIRQFNLMFETNRGVIKDQGSLIYLRPETAQGQFVNFLNVYRTMRPKLPFGIGQIGKAFRNEITPGNFTFRTIEFEQMEHQLFCKEGTDEELYEYYKKFAFDFFIDLGISSEHLRYKDHEKLAHYAKAACDVEFKFPFGWGEIYGNHNRTDFDLKRHQEYSGKSMEYLDLETNEKIIPYVVESSCGADRLTLAVLCEAYDEEDLDGEIREVMRFSPAVAPYKATILPLMKKVHSEKAMELYRMLSKYFMVQYDEAGNIGKRYRRSDVVGTPFAITIDDETLNNDTVTVRDRDTMKQITLPVEEIITYITEKIKF